VIVAWQEIRGRCPITTGSHRTFIKSSIIKTFVLGGTYVVIIAGYWLRNQFAFAFTSHTLVIIAAWIAIIAPNAIGSRFPHADPVDATLVITTGLFILATRAIR
jgi:hypothetical protein